MMHLAVSLPFQRFVAYFHHGEFECVATVEGVFPWLLLSSITALPSAKANSHERKLLRDELPARRGLRDGIGIVTVFFLYHE